MKKVLKKLISIMLIIILLGCFEAPSIFQTVYAVSEIVARDTERGDIFANVFSIDDLENIMPFSLENFRDNLTRDYIIGEFEDAGKTITNKDELPELIGTGTEIKTFFETYTALVYGDVDGNGRVTVADAEKASRHAIRKGEYTLTGVYELAANVVNTDDKITVGDAEYIFRFALGRVTKIPYVEPSYPTPTPTPTPDPGPGPIGPPVTPTVRLNVTAELEQKDTYYYVDEHKITVKATRQDNGNVYNITSISATIKKDGKTATSSEAKIIKVGKQDDGSYVLNFVAQTPGTYTVTVKVNSDTAEIPAIEIKENKVVSNVIFGDKSNPIRAITLTTGQENKEVPITFTNTQGKEIIPDNVTVGLSPESANITAKLSEDKSKLILSGTAETDEIQLNILVDGNVIGTIPVSVVAVINTVETIVTSTEADGTFLKEEQYPVTVKLNGVAEKIAKEKISFAVYNAKTNRTTSNAKVVPAENAGEYYFTATATGSYKVIATIPKDGVQEEVKEVLASKTVIEVIDNKAVDKVVINNKITVAEGSTPGVIEVYNTQAAQILPMKFYHKYSNGEITLNNVEIQDLTFETSSEEVSVEGRKAGGAEGLDADILETLYVIGKNQGAGDVTVTVKYKGTEIGTFTVSVINPTIEVKAVKTTTPIEMYIGPAPKRTDLFIKTEKDEATGITKTYTYTLFNITKLNKNGTKLSAIDYSEIKEFVIGITDGTRTLDLAQIDVIGLNGTREVTSGEITRIGIRIADEPANDTINEDNLNMIIDALKENGGTLTIGYKGLKTKEGNDQYEFTSVKIAKLITEVNSSITPETNGSYYKEKEYPVTVTYGKGEGPAEKLDWIITKNGSTTTDATVKLNEETGKYYFTAKATGTYKVRAVVLSSGSQSKVQETTNKDEITVQDDISINKIVIGSKDGDITVTPNDTPTLDVYNGIDLGALPISFYHVYSNPKDQIKRTDIAIKDITFTYGKNEDETDKTTSDKVTVEGRKVGGEAGLDTDTLETLYVMGKNQGTEDVEVTIKYKGTEIGTLTVSVRNPRISIAPVKTPTEMYLNQGPEGRDDLRPGEFGSYTLFEVKKVDKNGNKLALINLDKETPKFNVEVSDGAKTLPESQIDSTARYNENKEAVTGGEISYIGIWLDEVVADPDDEALVALVDEVIGNLKQKGTLTIGLEGLETAEDKDTYNYEIKVVETITSVETEIKSETNGSYYKEKVYPITVTVNNKQQVKIEDTISFEKYKEVSGTYKPLSSSSTDVVVGYDSTKKQYTFKANVTGNYKVVATVKGTTVGEDENTKTAITVQDDISINKVVIGSKDGDITVTPNETPTLDVYNGVDLGALPISFYHVYSDPEDQIKRTDITIKDITFTYGKNEDETDKTTSDKVTVEGRKVGGEAGLDTDTLETLYVMGKSQGTEDVEVTIKYKGTEIGTLTVSVRNPRISIAPVKTPTEMYLNQGPEGRDDLRPGEFGSYTLFEVKKVDKNGNKLALINLDKETPKFNVEVSDGAKTLPSSQIDSTARYNENKEAVTGGEISYIGIWLDEVVADPDDEALVALVEEVIGNLKQNNGGTLTIGLEGLKTAEDNDYYTYTISVE